jgi:hypothetical protein
MGGEHCSEWQRPIVKGFTDRGMVLGNGLNELADQNGTLLDHHLCIVALRATSLPLTFTARIWSNSASVTAITGLLKFNYC